MRMGHVRLSLYVRFSRELVTPDTVSFTMGGTYPPGISAYRDVDEDPRSPHLPPFYTAGADNRDYMHSWSRPLAGDQPVRGSGLFIGWDSFAPSLYRIFPWLSSWLLIHVHVSDQRSPVGSYTPATRSGLSMLGMSVMYVRYASERKLWNSRETFQCRHLAGRVPGCTKIIPVWRFKRVIFVSYASSTQYPSPFCLSILEKCSRAFHNLKPFLYGFTCVSNGEKLAQPVHDGGMD